MDMYYSLTLVATLPINQVQGNSRTWFWETFADGDYSLNPCDHSPH